VHVVIVEAGNDGAAAGVEGLLAQRRGEVGADGDDPVA
jgi:hypothetical protein